MTAEEIDHQEIQDSLLIPYQPRPNQAKSTMTKQEATDFFADFYQGEHHIPSEVKKYGDGWCIHTNRGDSLSTTDYSNLTRLIVLGHDRAVRVCLKGHNFGRILIIIHQRDRSDDYSKGHPTIEENIKRVRDFTQNILGRIGRIKIAKSLAGITTNEVV